MGIQRDAGELLILIYNNKIEGNENLQQSAIEKITSWDKDKVTFALEYLIKKGLLDGQIRGNLGTSKTAFILVRDIDAEGIDVIENEPEFNRNFGFTIGIPGVFSFSWGASEK